ncbi:hypothetical protein [Legionella sainthelensi]|uniref:hypothetical protein n=1 Tax=Legionella sainthelensi TaxID=28087 RepID=UPI000E20374E|nr:hypothetical protein [Legionella sainthelensi]
MPKSDRTTPAYNALFQEHSSPSVGLDRYNRTFPTVDTGQSCHVFATASAPSWEKRKSVNETYENIGTAKAFELMDRQDQHELAEKRKKRLNPEYIEKPFPGPSVEERRLERNSNMDEILELRNLQETVLPVENMYLCGGFREGKMTPEHMWIEDHTNNRSYDTFINRGGIAVVNGVGVIGQPFKPGCEGHEFDGDDIGRVKVAGYTYGQLIAIAAGAEKKPPFPESIANTPQVLMAIETVKLVNEALAKIPQPVFTEAEQNILRKVQQEQLKKSSDKEIKKVVEDLVGADKINYESALDKLAEAGRQQRETAVAIVGTTFNPFVKLSQDLSAIKPEQITTAPSIEEATELRTNLLRGVEALENKKGTIAIEYQEKFQQKIDEARNKIESVFAAKERVPLELMLQELNNTINPEQIKQSKSFKEAKNHYNELMERINHIDEKCNTLPEKLQGELKKEIESLSEKIRQEFKTKLEARAMVSKIETAATKYLSWSNQNATGWRLSNLSYGSYGREQAQKLLDLIKNEDTPTANILNAANDIVNTSGTNKNSFSRYLYDELKSQQLVGQDTLKEKFKNYKTELQTELNQETLKEERDTGMRF